MNVERYEDIFRKEKEQLTTNESGLSDFSDGSIITTMLETFARRIEELYIDTRNGFNTNLKAIPYSIFNFQKKSGGYAVGEVTFYRDKAINNDTIIPIGTEVKAGDLVFRTTSEGKIPADALESDSQLPIYIVASEIGSLYNLEADKINTISSILPSDVVRVMNKNKTAGGIDAENDTEMYKRFINYINGLDGNNIYALKAAVGSIDGIKDVAIKEHFPPDENGNNFTLYVNVGGEGLSSEIQDEIKKVVNGNGTNEYPGHKATGIQWKLQSANFKTIDIVYSATCEIADQSSVDEQMETIIKDTINNLKIGQSLIITDLLSRLKSLPFVKDCKIISPEDNVNIDEGYVAIAGDIKKL